MKNIETLNTIATLLQGIHDRGHTATKDDLLALCDEATIAAAQIEGRDNRVLVGSIMWRVQRSIERMPHQPCLGEPQTSLPELAANMRRYIIEDLMPEFTGIPA